MTLKQPKNQDHPSPQVMGHLFYQCGVRLTDDQVQQLWTYHGLLRRNNQLLNLTRIHNFTNMVLKLYVDSVLPGQLMELPSPLMDLGSGPGMPGIPLKILHPEIDMRLAESRSKRVAFLSQVIETLNLSGIELIRSKITPRYTQPVAGVITRAVESIPKTLERIKGCLQQNGQVIFMKGPDCDDEIQAALTEQHQRFELTGDTAYGIGPTSHRRRLVVFKRMDLPARAVAEAAACRHPTQAITSASNARFKSIKKVLGSRGIKKTGRALMAGERQVAEMLRQHPEHCLKWISQGDRYPPPSVAPDHLIWLQLARSLFHQVDIFGTGKPLLMIDVPPIEPWHPKEGLPEGCTVLLPFQDPENMGAALRSTAAFGADQVILLAESAHPYHPKSLRASGGTIPQMRLLQGPALDELPLNLPILALSAEGTPLGKIEFPKTFGLLPGLEGPGLPEHWRSKAVRIPIDSKVESLNAAVSVGIALYEWQRRCR